MKARRPRALPVAVCVGAALLGFLALGVPWVGLWLVVADPLGPSDAIVVLCGGTPAREIEAAVLYHRRLAPRVLLSRERDPLDRAARALAGEPAPQELALRVLVHSNVRADDVVRLDRVVENTEEELREVFAAALDAGFARLILVTAPAHTRRVRILWDRRHQARMPALVHPTPWQPFDGARWWRSRRTLEAGVHELASIVHIYLGSPLPTFDRLHEER